MPGKTMVSEGKGLVVQIVALTEMGSVRWDSAWPAA